MGAEVTPVKASFSSAVAASPGSIRGTPTFARTTRVFDEKDLHVLRDEQNDEEDEDTGSPWLIDHQGPISCTTRGWCGGPCDGKYQFNECQCFNRVKNHISGGRIGRV